MKVRDVMTVDPVACEEACPISMVATVMFANDCSAVPIVRPKMVVGIVAQSDLGRQMSDEQFGGMSMRISIRSDHDSTDLSAPVRRAASQNRVHERRPSVLLVEDDPGTRTFLTLLLERNGCDVDAVSDGVQALQKLKQNQYASVLLDLLMPRLNGFEVLQAVRALWPEMLGRIVVLTAASDITLADFPDEKRIFRLLRKPLENAEVLSVVWSCAARLSVPAVRESQLAACH